MKKTWLILAVLAGFGIVCAAEEVLFDTTAGMPAAAVRADEGDVFADDVSLGSSNKISRIEIAIASVNASTSDVTVLLYAADGAAGNI